MSESLVVRKSNTLPGFSRPTKLEQAARVCDELETTTQAAAYLVGRTLQWVRTQPEGDTKARFENWVETNVKRFKVTTAWGRVSYAKRCDEAGELLDLVEYKSSGPELLSPPLLPTGKYRVLYADPPWEYSNSGFNQSAALQYSTMSTDEICKLPVGDLVGDLAVLFMWVTSPILPDGLRVMSAWGFDYKASMVWHKNRAPGMGWWVKTKHEFLLIGAYGDVGTPVAKPESILVAPVGRHSEKPPEFRSVIESMFSGPYIELFARKPVDGWEVWGNEV